MTTLETAFLLPPEAYYADSWWDREQAELFERTWTFAGPITDVPLDGGAHVVPTPSHRSRRRSPDGWVTSRT